MRLKQKFNKKLKKSEISIIVIPLLIISCECKKNTKMENQQKNWEQEIKEKGKKASDKILKQYENDKNWPVGERKAGIKKKNK